MNNFKYRLIKVLPLTSCSMNLCLIPVLVLLQSRCKYPVLLHRNHWPVICNNVSRATTATILDSKNRGRNAWRWNGRWWIRTVDKNMGRLIFLPKYQLVSGTYRYPVSLRQYRVVQLQLPICHISIRFIFLQFIIELVARIPVKHTLWNFMRGQVMALVIVLLTQLNKCRHFFYLYQTLCVIHLYAPLTVGMHWHRSYSSDRHSLDRCVVISTV